MARRFYRIGPAIWLEPWDDDTRMVAFYLLTSPHRTTEGLFRLPLEYGRTDMGWPAKRFNAAFSRLMKAGFVEYDEGAQVVLLVNALRWQAPANPNQIKAAVRQAAELPPTPLLNRLRMLAAQHCEPLAEALQQRFTEPLLQPVANTPSPTPSIDPPNPPRGNRKRDKAGYENDLRSFAVAVFGAACTEDHVQAVRGAWNNGARDKHAVMAWIGQWRPDLGGAA